MSRLESVSGAMAYLTLDDSDARAAAEELRTLVSDGSEVSRYLRDRIAAMLASSDALEVVRGPAGLKAQPSPEVLSLIATLRAHRTAASAIPGR